MADTATKTKKSEPQEHHITAMEQRDKESHVLWVARCECGWESDTAPSDTDAIDLGREHLSKENPMRATGTLEEPGTVPSGDSEAKQEARKANA